MTNSSHCSGACFERIEEPLLWTFLPLWNLDKRVVGIQLLGAQAQLVHDTGAAKDVPSGPAVLLLLIAVQHLVKVLTAWHRLHHFILGSRSRGQETNAIVDDCGEHMVNVFLIVAEPLLDFSDARRMCGYGCRSCRWSGPGFAACDWW